MKEFFLRTFFAGEELDIIDKQRVQRPIMAFKIVDGIVLQDQMITESMGAITDRTFEHLAPSDIMITRTRRALLKAALRFRDYGELPASAGANDVYEGVRGGHFVAPENDDWLDAYQARVAASPLAASEAAE